jgi:hypothetical protein
MRDVLVDFSRSDHPRRLALHLVTRFKRVTLPPDLLDIALDNTNTAWIRADAVRRLAGLVSVPITELVPLARVPRVEDPRRELAYTAREVLFPEIFGLEDLVRLAREDAERDRDALELPPPAELDSQSAAVFLGGPHAQGLQSALRNVLETTPVDVLAQALASYASLPKFDASAEGGNCDGRMCDTPTYGAWRCRRDRGLAVADRRQRRSISIGLTQRRDRHETKH